MFAAVIQCVDNQHHAKQRENYPQAIYSKTKGRKNRPDNCPGCDRITAAVWSRVGAVIHKPLDRNCCGV